MPSQGYVRFPTIFQDRIVFVSEDDLWLVSSSGGRAERLTAGTGRISYPRFAPNGQLLAFVGREEGPSEVYIMPAPGGPAQRLTFQSTSSCRVAGWSPSGEHILYASSAGQFTTGYKVIYAISPQGGQPQQLPFGMANAISYGPQGGIVLGRNSEEPAYWKRYRGGTVGHLWCDTRGDGNFVRLLQLRGNIVDPCWVGDRIYFLSDHEGVGNVYSCTPLGTDLRRHTQQQDFYARHLSTDGHRLVFQAAADLYLFDPYADTVQRVDITLPSQRAQLSRKFVSATSYLDTFELHPQGYALALTTRGKAFTMSNWEGAVLQYGEPDGVRYRFLQWLYDEKRLVAICDAPGREALVIFDPEEAGEAKQLADIELGRVVELAVSPADGLVAVANHRNELLIVDVRSEQAAVLDHSEYGLIEDLAWSPDGRWLAYSFASTSQKRAIKLGYMESGETYFATEPVLQDISPSFDPDGKYLYFLGYRAFNPVRDSLQFEFSFPRGIQPYAITLRKDLRSPFTPESKLLSDKEASGRKRNAEGEASENGNKSNGEKEEKGDEGKKPRPLTIDLEGITARAIPFPIGEGRYRAICGIRGKVLLLAFPLQATLSNETRDKGWIESFDLETQKNERLIENVSDFRLSRDAKTLLYRTRQRFRIAKAGEKVQRSENNDHAGRDTGWLDLGRIKVSVQPSAEWKQMFAEAWRLQREQFWDADMSGIDWDAVYAQYAPLLERVGSRSELSDLLHELQGELGTSHAYEYGGEYYISRYYRQGFLGVDWTYDAAAQRYRIGRIVYGDPSNKEETSPLMAPGLQVSVGDAVLAINGQRLSPQRGPQELLVNQAGNEVQLTIEEAGTQETRVITSATLSITQENAARYRDWVEQNRRFVHAQSQGKIGYIHIPDMQARGYAEFHRSYLSEYDYPALVIDVRWNGGGNVSGLLLEKLARRRLGYTFSRWGQPTPYQREAPQGPMVALTNEHAGSDGDIFSHCFKLMKLGPLIGKRTWGGVIGIIPRHRLVDGTSTTQPEFAYWFKDVGWEIENYGTDPDIEVDIAPQDYQRNADPQLERAVQEALRLLEEAPPLKPEPGERPRRTRLAYLEQLELPLEPEIS
ncbi:peptidase [Ktedonosporobacter rubrisoli]|uniref:Tricorn protease homolog n=1 Tax=Ktedonosporobacter rubrisoli TaxID=2509675 RepID=A0A4P6K363_KTERU|nr:S41 family peptidase [Ktedonosporobacter rubrisoli]QBD82333.1 peptidase [Ktedonosporobacter rubrisoli]